MKRSIQPNAVVKTVIFW